MPTATTIKQCADCGADAQVILCAKCPKDRQQRRCHDDHYAHLKLLHVRPAFPCECCGREKEVMSFAEVNGSTLNLATWWCPFCGCSWVFEPQWTPLTKCATNA